MTNITDLPSELIAGIVAFLDDNDVFHARLAARLIERSSSSHFGKRFFRKKGYMLTTPSLNILASISKHNDLRKFVQHIWFNPDCFTFVTPECAPDPQEMPDPDPNNPDSLLDILSPLDRRRYVAYMACMKDHSGLLAKSASRLQAMLTDIFATLPNLKIVGMRRSEDHAPWGWRKLYEDIGQDPRELGPLPSGPMYVLSGPTRLFLALVKAIAASNTIIRRLYTDAVEIDNIRPDLLSHSVLDKACRSIWYLEINVTKAWLNQRKVADYTQLLDGAEYGNGLAKLFNATAELKEIGLQIFPDRKQSHILAPTWRDPASWRQSYPYLALQAAVAVPLPFLERVKLEKVTTSPATLLAFLEPSKNHLTSLKIRDVRLLSDEEYPRSWQSIFFFLRDSCPQLAFILFYHLLYEGGGISFVQNPPLTLPPSETDPTTGAPNPAFNEGAELAGEKFFMKYEHIALQVQGVEAVRERLEKVVEKHWYQQPIFSYQMDDGVWHTDTSDEEW
ncbi:hypothetical protein LTR62_005235 [Meristemomyces frigidus]|uniref:F-box domain-containing protein n=1 Tax=Meristemomyces frigidus TaxID=1508187 RepID=A0AAN7TDK4_9PEZI|nr:hypothetical protein LTR62_005235 [Meristemomyces frigidus]